MPFTTSELLAPLVERFTVPPCVETPPEPMVSVPIAVKLIVLLPAALTALLPVVMPPPVSPALLITMLPLLLALLCETAASVSNPSTELVS